MIPPKVTSSSSETSKDKTHDTVEESVEQRSSTKTKTDNTGHTSFQEQTTISELEKIKVPSSENYSEILSA